MSEFLRGKRLLGKVNGGGFELPLSQSLPPPYLSLKIGTFGRKQILSQVSLREKYVKEGLKVEQIATLANSSDKAVKKRLTELGLIKTAMRRKERAQIKARSIAEIKRLRDSGLSMRKIASKLTVLGYPNLIGGTRWHPMMVRRLLNETIQSRST